MSFLSKLDPGIGGGKTKTTDPNFPFFLDYHNSVIRNNAVGRDESGKPMTMKIGSVGLGDRTYLLPFYDPETRSQMDVQTTVKKFLPMIRSGQIKGYGDVSEAERARREFYPLIVGDETD